MTGLKRILLGVLLLILVLIGGATIFIATFDPNAHKAAIIDQVKVLTGRTLVIDGPIEMALWPKLRLKVGKLSLSNAAGFGASPMLAIQELQIAVATWPLLARRIEMDTVVVRGAQLALAKNADGLTNWADLTPPDDAPKKGGRSISALLVGGIDIKDAELTWQDASTAREITVNALNVSSGPLALDAPVALKLAAQLTSTKPALNGHVSLSGTINYDLKAQRYTIQPFEFASTLNGKTLPGGVAEVTGSANLDLSLANGSAKLSALKFEGLGTTLTGDLTLDHLQEPRPGGNGNITLTSKDLAILFRAFALPAANQIVSLKNRSFDIQTTFDANMDTGDLAVPTLTISVLGAQLSGTLSGARIDTNTPTIKGELGAEGADLPVLLVVASQLRSNDAASTSGIAKALAAVKDRSFKIATTFDADLKDGRIEVPKLTARLLGNELKGAVSSTVGNAGKPVLKGELAADGPDLPSLVMAIAAMQGVNSRNVDALNSVLGKHPNKEFSFKTTLNADLNADRVALPALAAHLFGNEITGQLAATAATSGQPSLQAELRAKGPDLPALLAFAGGFQGANSNLIGLARKLASAPDKSFEFKTSVAADLKAGRTEISGFSAKSLGLSLDGAFKATELKGDDGSAIDGHVTLNGANLEALLSALGQADLAKSVKTLHFEAGIGGNTQKLAFRPFTAVAQIAGVGTASPVELKLTVGTAEANLAHETATLKDLTMTGLGMNMHGALSATQIKSAPKYSGQLSVPTFDLRAVLASLNKPITSMADSNTLTRVGLTTDIDGTASSLALSGIELKVDETTVTGKFAIKEFAQSALDFDLILDKLDADRYLAPRAANKPAPMTPEAAVAGAAQLPLETLRKINVHGKLAASDLKISGIKLTDLALAVQGENGALALSSVTADLYRGKYTGVVTLDARANSPQLEINTTLAKVEVEPLLVDMRGKSDLTGTLNFEAKLAARGADSKQIKRTLTGPASFALKNGVVRGIDVPAVLNTAELMLASKGLAGVPKGGATAFQALTGSLDFQNGVIENKDLLLDGLGFKVTGEGVLANLNDMTIHYDTRISIDEGQVEKGAKQYKLGGYVIPLRCRGVISGTSCLPDLGELAKTAATNAVKEKVKQKLEKAVGGGAGKALKNLLKF